MKANLMGIPETQFITLRIRAAETNRKKGVLKDPYAVNILSKLEFEASNKNRISTPSQVGTIIRTLIIDELLMVFLKENPNGVVINLGCGLDARSHRIPLSRKNNWIDIDVPESIELRKQFFQEYPNYQMLAKSMFDYTWMDFVPIDRPLFIMAEGVMMYFDEQNIKAMFNELATRFTNITFAFDLINTWCVRNTNKHPDVKKYNAPFLWGTDNPKKIEEWNSGLKVQKMHYYFNRLKSRWPLYVRLAAACFPTFRKAFGVITGTINKV